MDAGLWPTGDRLTVAAYLEDWLDATRDSIRPATWTRYRGIVRTHHVPHLGRIPLSKLTATDVERMLREMTGSPRTRHHARAVLRTALQRAVAHGLILRNPAALAAPPRVEHREAEAWDAAQVRTFLQAVRGHRLEALFTVAVTTGLRQGELLGLRWSDVDLTAGTLTVRHALQRVDGRLQLVEIKTPRSRRTVPLPELALRALRKPQDGPLVGTHLFTTQSGSPLYSTAVYRAFLDVIAAIGLPRIRFHSLRHTAASLLLAQGTHPRVVMEMLGHSTIALTMNTYSHVIPALERDAADRMNAILSSSVRYGYSPSWLWGRTIRSPHEVSDVAHLDVSGKWEIRQSNIGRTVWFDIQQSGRDITGRAGWFSLVSDGPLLGSDAKSRRSMEARGTVTEREFEFAVSWNDGARGIYRGALLSDGTLAGQTWDEMRPSNKASWHSTGDRRFSIVQDSSKPKATGKPIAAMGRPRPKKSADSSARAIRQTGSPDLSKLGNSPDVTERVLKAKPRRIPGS
jgi:integrase